MNEIARFDGLNQAQALELLSKLLPEDAKDLALSLVCPICGKGPFKSLASHLPKKHGLRARWLHDAVGIPWSHALIADSLRQRFSETSSQKPPEHFEKMQSRNNQKGQPARKSEAGRQGSASVSTLRMQANADILTADEKGRLKIVEGQIEAKQAELNRLRFERAQLCRAAVDKGVSLSELSRIMSVSIGSVANALELLDE